MKSYTVIQLSIHFEAIAMQAAGVLETCLYVDDLDAAAEFYQRVLGLAVHSRQEGRHVFFRCGQSMLLLFLPEVSQEEGGELPPHGAVGPGHVALTMYDKDIDAWREHLQASGVEIERQLQWPQGGTSLYFRDPAGNSVELATPRIWGL